MSTDDKAIALLFQRPLEPVFTTRDNGKTAFDLPDSFFTERYQGSQEELQNRFAEEVELKIPIMDLDSKPDLSFTEALGKKEQFSLFHTVHRKIASQLLELLLKPKDKKEFLSLAAYIKDRVNPVLFQYCLSVVVQHRPDTSNIAVPAIAEIFPSHFVEPSVLHHAREEASLIADPGNRIHIEIPLNYTASDKEEEQRLAYFREDIGVNMHHWHWHSVYPGDGPDEIVRKDRRGELFYYMHHQVIARFNVERFCNNLGRIKPFSNLREPIREAYFPKLMSSETSRTYPGRAKDQVLGDLERENMSLEVAEAERWRDRIIGAIDQGFVVDKNDTRIPLDEVKGIDILGDLVEASDLSVNKDFYGDLHNKGHLLIASSHDPENRHLEGLGVMGDVTTAMRDPIFYRWHGFIDSIYSRLKARLRPYDDSDLAYKGILLEGIEAKVNSGSSKPNVLLTYWQKSDVDLAAGLDFGPNGNVYASFTHLQYAAFTYNIKVKNTTGRPQKGTCRIFICPKHDERGIPLKLEEVRLLAIELDRFVVTMTPGDNTFQRAAADSSVTIPYERSFRKVGTRFIPSGGDALERFRYCGCGWPDHMLLPKGKPEGMQFDLFAMISDYKDDAVVQTNKSPDECGDAAVFCGIKDKKYPDRRSMGYPFDRRLEPENLAKLTDTYSNMVKTDVTIFFNNRVVERK